MEQRQPKEFDEKVIEIKRLSKKTKGGNKISFSALVVIGDNNGRAGVGLSKAKDVLSAIQKSIRQAKKNLKQIKLANGTIPHEVFYKNGASVILMKPAPEGTGVIAGGAVRAVVEAFGIKNIVSKCMGTSNKTANVFATFEALNKLKYAQTERKPVPADKAPIAPEAAKTVQPVKEAQKTAPKAKETGKAAVKKTAGSKNTHKKITKK